MHVSMFFKIIQQESWIHWWAAGCIMTSRSLSRAALLTSAKESCRWLGHSKKCSPPSSGCFSAPPSHFSSCLGLYVSILWEIFTSWLNAWCTAHVFEWETCEAMMVPRILCVCVHVVVVLVVVVVVVVVVAGGHEGDDSNFIASWIVCGGSWWFLSPVLFAYSISLGPFLGLMREVCTFSTFFDGNTSSLSKMAPACYIMISIDGCTCNFQLSS